MQKFRIWFAFLGGALAWTVHLMFGAFFSELACRSRLDHSAQGGVLVGLAVLTVVCLGLAIVSLLVGRGLVKGQSPEEGVGFMNATSLWINSFFIAVIAGQSLPIFMGVRGC